MIFSTTTIVLFVIVLACAVLTHYLGFSSKDEFLFFSRRQAQALFFPCLFLLIAVSYVLWREYRVPNELSLHIKPYEGAFVSMWLPSVSKSDSKHWTFNTFDSPQTVKEYYLKRKNRGEWEIRTKEEEGILVLEKGNLDLTIQITERKNGKSDIFYTLEERVRE
ncbi:MAG: hypothetical protein KAQ64_00105 [Candidatus Pacebacteria bacterium]|nr:hypothetical protein [Candidatus Paceibacterota bacterium]